MNRINTFLGAAAIMGVCSTGAFAQHSYRLATEVERIENPLLSGVNPGGVTVLRAAGDYAYEMQRDRIRSRFNAGLVLERSSDTVLLANRNYPSLGYTFGYTWPTASLELRANVAESATRNTQFEDLRRVTIDASERTSVLGGTWNKELTERTDLTLDVANNRVTYDTPLLESYRELEVTSRFSWEVSDRTVYYFEPGYGRLNPDGLSGDSRLTRWVGGMRGELSPEWSLVAFAGQARVRGVRTSTDLLGGVQLGYTGSRLTGGLEWTRDVQPVGSASGYVKTDTLGARAGYQLAEGMRLVASTSRSRWGGPTGGVGLISRLALEKELAERWSTTFAVEDRRFRDSAGVSGRGWAVRAGLVYTYSEL